MKRAEAIITMSMRELDRIKVIQSVIEGTLKPGIAAQRLQLTSRQIRRMVLRYQHEGPAGLASKRRGRPSNHQLHPGLEQRAARLQNISCIEEANAFIANYVADHNARFAKSPRSDHNTHRPLRDDENLDLIFTWREPRCVTKNLTVQYDKVMYLIEDGEETRSLAGHYIDVYQYPDGRVALHAQGRALPLQYRCLDRLSEIDQGAIVENKRLGHVLRVLQEVQSVRDNRRSLRAPSLTHIGEAPRRRGRAPGKKSSRALDASDMLNALNTTAT